MGFGVEQAGRITPKVVVEGRRDDSSDDEDKYTAGTRIHRGDGNRGNGGGGGTGGHPEHCWCKECWESRYGPHTYDGRWPNSIDG